MCDKAPSAGYPNGRSNDFSYNDRRASQARPVRAPNPGPGGVVVLLTILAKRIGPRRSLHHTVHRAPAFWMVADSLDMVIPGQRPG